LEYIKKDKESYQEEYKLFWGTLWEMFSWWSFINWYSDIDFVERELDKITKKRFTN
jgi:hypothetical protein